MEAGGRSDQHYSSAATRGHAFCQRGGHGCLCDKINRCQPGDECSALHYSPIRAHIPSSSGEHGSVDGILFINIDQTGDRLLDFHKVACMNFRCRASRPTCIRHHFQPSIIAPPQQQMGVNPCIVRGQCFAQAARSTDQENIFLT